MPSLADTIRAYALGPLNHRTDMMALPHVLVEGFLCGRDWDTHSLWSVEWRTFALIVAEALDDDRKRLNRYKAALA